MEYLRFTTDVVNALNFTDTEVEELNDILQSELKLYITNRRSYATSDEQLAQILLDIENDYKNLVANVKPRYAEVKRISNGYHVLRTRDLTQTYGSEETQISNFDPFVNQTQQEVKQSASNTNWQPDDTSENSTEQQLNSENEILKKFYDDLKFIIINIFEKYINNLFII